MNTLITPEWMVREAMRMYALGPRPRERSRIDFAEPAAVPLVVIPPPVLIAGLAVAVAAKVPFSRRRLLMPWRVDDV